MLATQSDLGPHGAATGGLAPAPWLALWTRSHCEQLVFDQVASRGMQVFLPTLTRWSGSRRRHLVREPLFPGYLFLHERLDRHAFIRLLGTRGLAAVLGESWDHPEEIPDGEIQSIRRITDSGLAARPHAFLREGQRVRIVNGPLLGLEGIYLRSKSPRGMLVLSVSLLQRSVAVEVDSSDVDPA